MTRRATPRPDAAAHHETAIAKSLACAHEAAACGDYADAILWMRTLDAVGHTFSAQDTAARTSWTATLMNR